MSTVSEPAVPPSAEIRPQIQPPRVDESHLPAAYANFCRVLGTPEELIVDFGLNTQPFGATDAAVPMSQRIVLNYFTAKRLLQALGTSIARHEAIFGVVETNVASRVEQRAQQNSSGAGEARR